MLCVDVDLKLAILLQLIIRQTDNNRMLQTCFRHMLLLWFKCKQKFKPWNVQNVILRDQSSSTGSADGKKNFGFVSVIFRINFNNSASGYTDSINLTHGKLIKLVRFTLIFHQFSLYSHLVEEKSADLHLFTNKSIHLSK